MTGPRLEIDLNKITHNARRLVDRLSGHGIAVTGVTKATLGAPEIARAMLDGGVADLGDSRTENIETLRGAHVSAQLSLIRAPMPSQARRVVIGADVSYNSEIETVRRLSLEARKLNRTHAVIVMIELGDLREGFMPVDVVAAVGEILEMPNIEFRGIGTNLACRSGASPGEVNMGELSRIAATIEATFGIAVEIVSGGNSANLEWVFSGAPIGRINNLRLGESILLGRETLNRHVIEGLHTDAITLVAEVIESKLKPTQPSGDLAQTAFGVGTVAANRGEITQTLLAVGIQDTDPAGLLPPAGTQIIGSSSDHLITTSAADRVPIGSEMRFQLNYSALMRAMTSPFVCSAIRPAGNALAMRRTA